MFTSSHKDPPYVHFRYTGCIPNVHRILRTSIIEQVGSCVQPTMTATYTHKHSSANLNNLREEAGKGAGGGGYT